MRVLSAEQMREADRRAVHEIGIPSIVLMENAGHQVVSAMHATFGDLVKRRVAVLCGRGNNGGDGFVVARSLWQQGVEVQTFLLGRAEAVSGDAAVNLRIIQKLGLPLVEVGAEMSGPEDDEIEEDVGSWEDVRDEVLSCDLVVDAILGTGLRKPLDGLLRSVIADVNASRVPVVAVDLPTGLWLDHVGSDSDPGSESESGSEYDHDAMEAEITVTLAAPKIPLLVAPTEGWAGEVVVADIGIPASVIDRVPGERLEVITPEEVRWWIPPRPVDAHKGDFGRVLVVAGSVGKTGAAVLAGLGALRSGAGLVTVATPRRCVESVAAGAPEYMTMSLPDTNDGTVSAEGLESILDFPCDVVAVGPGLGVTPGVAAVVAGLIERADVPVVLDADALNVLASDRHRLASRSERETVLTPHPGEMARLCGLTTASVQADRIGVARRFAVDHHVTVILKGANTVVASPDGTSWLNLTGNPAMATGGVGDVLTGVTAAWIGQIGQAGIACQVAVYLHGLAGDIAADEPGVIAVTATDVVNRLGQAVAETVSDADREDEDRT